MNCISNDQFRKTLLILIFSIIAFMRRLPRLTALAMLAVALAGPAHADDARTIDVSGRP